MGTDFWDVHTRSVPKLRAATLARSLSSRHSSSTNQFDHRAQNTSAEFGQSSEKPPRSEEDLNSRSRRAMRKWGGGGSEIDVPKSLLRYSIPGVHNAEEDNECCCSAFGSTQAPSSGASLHKSKSHISVGLQSYATRSTTSSSRASLALKARRKEAQLQGSGEHLSSQRSNLLSDEDLSTSDLLNSHTRKVSLQS